MSVDNSAILFVGLPVGDIDPSLLPGIDLEKWEEDAEDYLYNLNRSDKLEIRYTSEYHDPDKLIGYCIGDSNSYGIKEIPDLGESLSKAKNDFREIFKQDAKIYLYNWQY